MQKTYANILTVNRKVVLIAAGKMKKNKNKKEEKRNVCVDESFH